MQHGAYTMSKIATYMEDFNLIGNFPLQAYTIFFFFLICLMLQGIINGQRNGTLRLSK